MAHDGSAQAQWESPTSSASSTLAPSPYLANQASFSYTPPAQEALRGRPARQTTNYRNQTGARIRRDPPAGGARLRRRASQPQTRTSGTLQRPPHTRASNGVELRPDHMRNWRVRTLLQAVRELVFDPQRDSKRSVIALSGRGVREAGSAIFSERIERPMVTAPFAESLGLQALDLPEGNARKPFISPWGGLIQPRRVVRLVIEQVRNNLRQVNMGEALLLDDDFPNYDTNLFLPKRTLQKEPGESLPPNAGVIRQSSMVDVRSGWSSTPTNPAMNDAAGNCLNLDGSISRAVAPPQTSPGAPPTNDPSSSQQGGQPWPAYQTPAPPMPPYPFNPLNEPLHQDQWLPADFPPIFQDAPQYNVFHPYYVDSQLDWANYVPL
ncbi:hypothetical protein MFIFM68171_05937 [Madurella fahalii]|uniref:Uncharacterized protein n=1 Tax=Madurella fahalii TaxID=1157608 RepID=A0ABQ0GD90_9PEZI